jgi:hypothetical protein
MAMMGVVVLGLVIAGGIFVWMNKCNNMFLSLGLCGDRFKPTGGEILERHNVNPDKQKYLLNAVKPNKLVEDVGPGEIAKSGHLGPKNPKGPISGKGVPLVDIKPLAKHLSPTEILKRQKAGYARANLAVESLSRMSY